MAGKLFSGVGARRIDTRPGLVDHAVGDVGLLERAGDQLGNERFGLSTGRAVAHRDHIHGVLLNKLHDACTGRLALLFLADDRQHGMLERHAALVDHDRLAAAFEAGIEGQHALAADRRLKEEIAEVAGKHGDGMPLAVFGDLPTDLALEAREHQPGD